MAQETTPLTIATLTTPNIATCLAAHNGLLYSGATNQIAVFDITNDFTQIDTLCVNDAASGSVKSIAFGPWKIFTAHQDCKIRVWKITRSGGPPRHRLLATLPTVKDRLYRFISPGNYVHVRRHRKRLWIEHWDAVSGVVVNGGFVYSVSWDRSFKVWSASDHKCLLSVKAHEDAVNAVAVGPNGVVYTGSADGVIGVWEVNAIALNEGGWAMFSGSSDRSIMVWKKEDGGKKISFVEDLWGHQGAVLCLYTFRDLLVSGSEDRTLRIWRGEVTNGFVCTSVMDGHRSPVKSLVLVSVEDGERSFMICSASLDGEIRVWSSKL
ncbi:vegetative incompatibility protein HET-E-1-like [Cucumis melo var. makuwa]|uniref:Vegetative incompatibility protein HET-E-1-like n=1 Tax=Cucumis melo var. makuwa TaxID=1194695 RepID=A0A5A7UPL5_CUCMM|nr:vegetative incompatibility protein HET-E-1-like [Cucumis melo var. makuwa]